MADTMRPMSLLPAITCSNCGVEIEISRLADHVCSSKPVEQEAMQPLSPPSKLDRAATFGNGIGAKSPGPLRLGRMPPPPRIDSSAANKPFRPREQLVPMNNYSDPKSVSPVSPNGGLRSPYKLTRSVTSPMPRPYSPPSPDLLGNMDCAFPPFPTSRSATPEPKVKARERLDPAVHSHRYADPDPLYAPLSPRTDGGESVLRRMNTMSPGPFDGRGGNSYERRASPHRGPEPGHKRSNTHASISSAGKGHVRNPSTASSIRSRSSTLSNGGTGLPTRPKLGPPTRPPRTEGIDAFLERLQSESQNSLSQDGRSKTFPLRKDSHDNMDPPPVPHFRRPSESSLRSQGMSGRSASRNGSTAGLHADIVPPLPSINTNQQSLPAKSMHTPSDSGYSDDSASSSDIRSAASSRSSPPGSETWGFSRRPSMTTDSPAEDRIPRMGSPESMLQPSANQLRMENRDGSTSYNRGNAPGPLNAPRRIPFPDGPESPMDPAIQKGLFSTRRPSYESTTSSTLPSSLTIGIPKPPPLPVSQAPADAFRRRPTTNNKGRCRGCEKPIIGKSIKAADGRLTGRYHKQCFVCKTCQEPFQTADFYVIDNHPYCEQHYHQLNGSLCKCCNRGIEGQYLETDLKQKFHPRCFTCDTCRIQLRDDYFEVGGKIFCERHAFHAAQQNTFLGAARRNPERRTTRLMMMM